jgi:hypothetical protein
MKIRACLLLFLFAFIGCSEDNLELDAVRESLKGEWTLAETLYAYTNGGSFMWSSQPAEHDDVLVFTKNGKYTQQTESPGSIQSCTGNFRVRTRNQVEIESSCQQVLITLKIIELTSTTLIIERPVREGAIRHKYTRSN